jgi:hypothetical protein
MMMAGPAAPRSFETLSLIRDKQPRARSLGAAAGDRTCPPDSLNIAYVLRQRRPRHRGPGPYGGT